jgi:hypothetical protein
LTCVSVIFSSRNFHADPLTSMYNQHGVNGTYAVDGTFLMLYLLFPFWLSLWQLFLCNEFYELKFIHSAVNLDTLALEFIYFKIHTSLRYLSWFPRRVYILE